MVSNVSLSCNFGNVSHDTTGKLLNGRPESIMFSSGISIYLQIRYALLEYFYLDCSIRDHSIQRLIHPIY